MPLFSMLGSLNHWKKYCDHVHSETFPSKNNLLVNKLHSTTKYCLFSVFHLPLLGAINYYGGNLFYQSHL